MKRGLNLRGQVSVFVIIGILIVASLGSLIYGFKVKNDIDISNEFFLQVEIKPQLENIHSNILWCLDETSKQALEKIGAQGGYYNKPIGKVETFPNKSRRNDTENFSVLDYNQTYSENGFVPYYYYKGDYLMPSNEKISRELKYFVEEKVDICLDELMFDGFELKHSKPKVNVMINPDEVVFEIDSSVTIEKEGKRSMFETKDYPVKKVSALNDILYVAKYITDSHRIDAKMYCVDCIEKIAVEKDVYVQSIPISNDSVLVIIAENRTSDKPYLFAFLNKYTNKEISDDIVLTGDYADKSPESLGGN